MTQQIRDRLILDGEEHVIPPIDLTDCPWPQVRRYISSVRKFSACWRGYYCKWELRNGLLLMVDIKIMWSGREEQLEYQEIFPDQPEGVRADWFSGEIEVPQGESLDLGHDFWMDEETLTLLISNGTLMGSSRHDNRQQAAEKAQQIQERYSRPLKPYTKAQIEQFLEEIDKVPETEIEAHCDEFMMDAMMGTIDEADLARWRRFYDSVKGSASPQDLALLEVVNNAILRRE